MKKDKRAKTSPENGKLGGRPKVEDRLVPVSYTLGEILRQYVKERGGSKYIRELIERDKENPV